MFGRYVPAYDSPEMWKSSFEYCVYCAMNRERNAKTSARHLRQSSASTSNPFMCDTPSAATGDVLTVGPSEYEKPTLTGWSRKSTLACSVQLAGLFTVVAFSRIEQGPFSKRRPWCSARQPFEPTIVKQAARSHRRRRAAGTAVEPEDEGVLGWLVAGLKEPEPQVLVGPDIEVSGEMNGRSQR